jgi:crotonobetainyl-CoA:carnitine CoA-transferase CaiB-like acyl-CoA transferase
MRKALEGIRILDLTSLLPGSFGTQLLADFGAKVIKVEKPLVGDGNRHNLPLYKTQTAFFVALNRNKRSITLNLKSDKGKEIFKTLTRKADVVVESFRPGVMGRLGLSYDVLKKINPQIIYCSLSGFGQNGPYRLKVGHDLNYISLSGLMSLMGQRGSPPVIPALPIADVGGGGLMLSLSVLISLQARQLYHIGQKVDLSLTDGVLSLMPLQMAKYFCEGKVPKKGENLLDGGYACYNVYRTNDGRYVVLAALEEKFWANFCQAIKREDLITKQFAEFSIQEDVKAELKIIFLTKSCQEWAEFFEGQDVCLEPVWELDEVVNHPQIKARKMIVPINHPTEGRVKQLGLPLKFSETPGDISGPSPDLGEYNKECLSGLGYNLQDIEVMRQEGVI